MSILFVTVGTTALYNEKVGSAPHGKVSDRALHADVVMYQDALEPEQDHVATTRNLMTRLVTAHTQFWKQKPEYVSDVKHFKETSAELTSTHTLRTHPPRKFERVVLLASDTKPGLLSAQVNRAIFEDVWKMPTRICTVKGLDAGFTETDKAIEGLFGEEFTSLKHGDEGVVFNVTGGFKGTVVGITLLAEKMDWEIYYQHESLSYAACIRFRSGPSKKNIWRKIAIG
jgi:putative CRISPR-associated protein (TIGR02619 family)